MRFHSSSLTDLHYLQKDEMVHMETTNLLKDTKFICTAQAWDSEDSELQTQVSKLSKYQYSQNSYLCV